MFDVRTPIDALRYGRLDDADLIASIKRRNPADDAATAVEHGSMGLIFRRVSFSMGYTLVPVEVVCQGSVGANDPPSGLGLTYIGQISSVQEAAPPRSESVERALLDYAGAYNRALVVHPAYRFRDVCAPGEPPGEGPNAVEKALWARPMQPPSSAKDLGDAARNGDRALVETFLKRGDPIDAQDPFRLTPLGWAIVRGHDDIALLLLGRGADPRAVRGESDEWPKPEALAKAFRRTAVLRAIAQRTNTP